MCARILILCAILSWTCDSTELPAGRATSTDSAGIHIVISDSSVVAAAAVAVVTPAPELDPRGPSEILEFYQVEGLTTLSGNAFGVINRSTGSVRKFDDRGNYQLSIGGVGEGPGEFRHLWFAAPYRGDSLLMHDGRLRRLTVFDAMGRVGRTFFFASHELYSPFITPVAVLQDGNLLVYSRAQMMGLVEYGVTVDSSVFGLHAPDGEVLSILGRLPTGARMRYLREGLITTLEAPFAPGVDGTAWQEGFCLGFGATFEIRCYDDGGALRRILRVAIEGQSVTAEFISRYETAQLAVRQSGRGAAFRRILEDITYPTELPVYDRLVGTSAGHLWVEAYRPFGEGRRTWWVLDGEGRLVGRVEFPERFAPFIFEHGVVRGVWRDTLDVEHIRTYRVEWPR